MNTVTTTRYIAPTAQPPTQRDKTDYLAVHHAAWVYAPGTACDSIFTYHSGKWPKYGRIGYHVVLQEERDGSITRYNVNPFNIQGANVALMNDRVLGVCAATDFGNKLPPRKWFDALVETFADLNTRYPNAMIVGHKDIARKGYETSCPGGKWGEWRADFMIAVQALAKARTNVYDPAVLGIAPSITSDHFVQLMVNVDQRVVLDRVYTLCQWLDVDPAFLAALCVHNLAHRATAVREYSNPLLLYASPALKVVRGFESMQIGLMSAVLHLKQNYGALGILQPSGIIQGLQAESAVIDPYYLQAVSIQLKAAHKR